MAQEGPRRITALGVKFTDMIYIKIIGSSPSLSPASPPLCLSFVEFFVLPDSFFFFKIFNLFIHERHRERERQTDRQAPCREPDMGLDPGSPGSRPRLKAGAKPLSHPEFLMKIITHTHRKAERAIQQIAIDCPPKWLLTFAVLLSLSCVFPFVFLESFQSKLQIT